MKHEWRKHEKEQYIAKRKPKLIEMEEQHFFTISGKGNPNDQEFQERIEVLYALSYAIRMMHKTVYVPEDYFEYTVYPLEGIWDLSEEGRKQNKLNKDELLYKIMIRQPDFVKKAAVKYAFETVRAKNKVKYLDDAKFESITEGLCVQMLHIGPYDTESETFKVMDQFAKENHLTRTSLVHKEIYLSDFRRSKPENLKTVLRYQVRKKGPTGVEFDFVVKDSQKALKEYQHIFDLAVIEETDFKLGNNEVVFNIYGSRFHMLDENKDYNLVAPQAGAPQSFWFNVTVPDIQATFDRVVAANLNVIQPVTRLEKMGMSNAMFSDSNGYVWMLHQVHRKVSFDERMDILSEDFE